MDKQNILYQLTEETSGYLLVREAVSLGISRPAIASFIKKKSMQKIASGIYKTEEAWDDIWFVLQSQYQETVFSGATALYFHGLLDREPSMITVTVKKGYNTLSLHKKKIKTYYTDPQLLSLGMISMETPFCHYVNVYDMDRSICDLIQHKNDFDIQDFQTAMKEYFYSPSKNIHQLMKYASKLKMEQKIRHYTEVLL